MVDAIIQSTNLWLALSLSVLLAVIYKPSKRAISNILEIKTKEALKDLHEARAMHEEAEKLIKRLKIEYKESDIKAQAIEEKARQEAVLILKEAEEEAENLVKRRMEVANLQIKQLEEHLIEDIRQQIITTAIAEIKQEVSASLDNNAQEELLLGKLPDLKRLLN